MKEYYDHIADKYDQVFAKPEYLDENREVVKMFADHLSGTVLDIGCGTGVLLDTVNVPYYVGLDPSAPMLDVFRHKHPAKARYLHNLTFEEYFKAYGHSRLFGLAVALFGSANYINPLDVHNIKRIAKKYFIMVYKPDYVPVSYVATRNGNGDYSNYTFREDSFKPEKAFDYHNYRILTNV